jgi:murein L,D-transpeptidase YcbB/YkuD
MAFRASKFFIMCSFLTCICSSAFSLPNSAENSEYQEMRFDSLEMINFFLSYPRLKPQEQSIRTFYRKRQYTFAWFKDERLVEQASIWSNKLSNGQSDGIYNKFVYQKTLDSLLDGQHVQLKKTDIELELLLTCLYFEYAQVAWNGMDKAASRSANWLIPRKNVSYDEYLDSILNTAAKNPLPREPVYRQYELLKNQLEKYRLLQNNIAWKPIATMKKARLGETSSLFLEVKMRLFTLGNLQVDTLTKVFDGNLASAIKRFQSRHGLTANGNLNVQTIAEMNVPLKNRIKQIVVNMERSRWLPLQVSGDHVAVNIPEYKLHVYHADSLLWSCNAVVGQSIHPTTQFYGEIQYLAFSPYWNVPPGILRNEIVPAMKKDPKYLVSHNMEITGYRNGIPVIRQKPGKTNALGQVKFMFPNSYNIYLHDTPAKSLFNEASRAFSHGCIRISEPEKFAAYLLRNKDGWGMDKIRQAMHGNKEKQVSLSKAVPVFIAYFTAFVDRDNQLNFRKDIYSLDDNLFDMIVSGEGH